MMPAVLQSSSAIVNSRSASDAFSVPGFDVFRGGFDFAAVLADALSAAACSPLPVFAAALDFDTVAFRGVLLELVIV